jgi:Hemerythrin HHE cation binding domain
MAIDTAGFHTAHKEMREHAGALRDLAEQAPDLAETERRDALARVVELLQSRVEPHTKLDEWLLYPAVADRLGDPLVAASMNYDHLAIRDWITKIENADPNDLSRLRRLLYGLDALIRVHVWKEEELFLAALESSSWPETST